MENEGRRLCIQCPDVNSHAPPTARKMWASDSYEEETTAEAQHKSWVFTTTKEG